jgi:hypothetical protein
MLLNSMQIFFLSVVGVFYPYNRGTLYTALISLYALTSSISGYVAASYYRQMGGELWVRNILLTCFVYCGPLLAVFSVLNTVAIAYRVSEPRQLQSRNRRVEFMVAFQVQLMYASRQLASWSASLHCLDQTCNVCLHHSRP